MKKYLVEYSVCFGSIADTESEAERPTEIVDAESEAEAIELVKTNIEECFNGCLHLDPDEATEVVRDEQDDLIFKNDNGEIIETDYNFTAKEIDSEKEVKGKISEMLEEKFTDSYFDDVGGHRTSTDEYDINGIYTNYAEALEDYVDANNADKKRELKKAFDTWTEQYISEEDFKYNFPKEYEKFIKEA